MKLPTIDWEKALFTGAVCAVISFYVNHKSGINSVVFGVALAVELVIIVYVAELYWVLLHDHKTA